MKNNWEYRPFDRVAHTITPISKIEKSEYLTCGLVPIISQEETVVSGYWNNSNDVTPHQKPVVIFGDHSRVLKYIDFEFVVGADGVKIIEPKEGINTKFLYYYLHWLNIPSLGYSRHFKLVKEALYAVPPMKIQEQIVGELDKINEIIEDCRELLRSLDTLAQSLFYDFFGDPVTNPKGWETINLKDIASVKIGPFGSLLHKEDYVNNGTPLVNPIHIKDKKVSVDYGFTISADKLKEMTPYRLKTGDVIFGRRGDIGRCALITEKENGYICGTGSLFVRFKIEIDPRFSIWCFSQPNMRDWLVEQAKGATMLNINCGIVERIKIFLPPLLLQQQFAAQVEAIEAQKKAVEATIAELETLLDSRMDYWFN